jgi:hypothetical protein
MKKLFFILLLLLPIMTFSVNALEIGNLTKLNKTSGNYTSTSCIYCLEYADELNSFFTFTQGGDIGLFNLTNNNWDLISSSFRADSCVHDKINNLIFTGNVNTNQFGYFNISNFRYTHRSIPSNFRTRSLILDKNNIVWIISDKHIFMYNVTNNQFTTKFYNTNFNFIREISRYDEKNDLIWIMTNSFPSGWSYLVYYNITNMNYSTNSNYNHLLKSSDVLNLHFTTRQSLDNEMIYLSSNNVFLKYDVINNITYNLSDFINFSQNIFRYDYIEEINSFIFLEYNTNISRIINLDKMESITNFKPLSMTDYAIYQKEKTFYIAGSGGNIYYFNITPPVEFNITANLTNTDKLVNYNDSVNIQYTILEGEELTNDTSIVCYDFLSPLGNITIRSDLNLTIEHQAGENKFIDTFKMYDLDLDTYSELNYPLSSSYFTNEYGLNFTNSTNVTTLYFKTSSFRATDTGVDDYIKFYTIKDGVRTLNSQSSWDYPQGYNEAFFTQNLTINDEIDGFVFVFYSRSTGSGGVKSRIYEINSPDFTYYQNYYFSLQNHGILNPVPIYRTQEGYCVIDGYNFTFGEVNETLGYFKNTPPQITEINIKSECYNSNLNNNSVLNYCDDFVFESNVIDDYFVVINSSISCNNITEDNFNLNQTNLNNTGFKFNLSLDLFTLLTPNTEINCFINSIVTDLNHTSILNLTTQYTINETIYFSFNLTEAPSETSPICDFVISKLILEQDQTTELYFNCTSDGTGELNINLTNFNIDLNLTFNETSPFYYSQNLTPAILGNHLITLTACDEFNNCINYTKNIQVIEFNMFRCPENNNDGKLVYFLVFFCLMLIFISLYFRQGFIGIVGSLFLTFLSFKIIVCDNLIGLLFLTFGLLSLVLFSFVFPLLIFKRGKE